jgi:hypothetical protein
MRYSHPYPIPCPSHIHKLTQPKIPADNFFVGGKVTDGKYVRLVIEHIAINWDENNKTSSNPKDYLAFVGEILRERFEPKGWT